MKKLARLMIIAVAFLTVFGMFVSAAEKYDVAAFYWPSLHFDERWAEFFPDGSQGEWESIRNSKPKWEGHWQPRVPAWGYLMDNDPAAMEKKIDAATDHGVNVMIFDWYWFENKPFLESAINDGFLKAKNVDKMKFYLMWANHDAKTAWDIRRSHKMETIWPGSVDLPTFKTVVACVIKKYFSHPSYYKIDGKPVFSIYDMNNLITGLGGVKQTVEALDYFRAEVKKAGFPDLHFQMIYWGRVPKIDDSGFASAKGTAANTIKMFNVDSLTNYQFVHLARPEPDYVKWADKALLNWPKWSRDFDIPYFPHVSIGWDNNARFVAKRGAVTDNVNPQIFKKYLYKAKAYADAHPGQNKLITINAWNEWVEGSYLEPDKRFGMGYLEAVKEVFVSPGKKRSAKADIPAKGADNSAARPNILFIAIDDLRPELGCYGNAHIKSPNLDSLASQGMVFNRAYCQIAVCGASRASLMTGVLPTSKRFVNYLTRVDEDAPKAITLPQAFKEAGYTTLSNGKIFHHKDDAEARSWSESAWRPKGDHAVSFDPATRKTFSKRKRGLIYEHPDVQDNVYTDGIVAEKTIKDLQRLKNGGKPFFLACGFIRPHMPFYAPKKYWDMYDREKIEIADNQFRPKNSPKELRGSGEYKSYHLGDFKVNSPAWHRMMRHGYYACVSYVDKLVGDVLGEMKRLGLAENTIVVVWGDHGWHLGEHNFWGKHNTMHLATRVPLIVKVPGKKSAKSEALVETSDIFPTLCDLAGIAAPKTVQGRSFKQMFDDPAKPFRDVVYTRFMRGDAVVTDRYSYTSYIKAGAEMLYDLKNDPDENRNVAGNPENAKIVAKMNAMLAERMQEARNANVAGSQKVKK